MCLLQRRICARSKAEVGTRDGCGNVSSRYSQMRVDSTIARPSWISVGTTPLGLSLRYSGRYCSLLKRSIYSDVQGNPFSIRVRNTFCVQIELCAVNNFSIGRISWDDER